MARPADHIVLNKNEPPPDWRSLARALEGDPHSSMTHGRIRAALAQYEAALSRRGDTPTGDGFVKAARAALDRARPTSRSLPDIPNNPAVIPARGFTPERLRDLQADRVRQERERIKLPGQPDPPPRAVVVGAPRSVDNLDHAFLAGLDPDPAKVSTRDAEKLGRLMAQVLPGRDRDFVAEKWAPVYFHHERARLDAVFARMDAGVRMHPRPDGWMALPPNIVSDERNAMLETLASLVADEVVPDLERNGRPVTRREVGSPAEIETRARELLHAETNAEKTVAYDRYQAVTSAAATYKAGLVEMSAQPVVNPVDRVKALESIVGIVTMELLDAGMQVPQQLRERSGV